MKNRIGEVRLNRQGCPMEIIEYIDYRNITIKFLDDYNTRKHTRYDKFMSGEIKNPYYPSVFGVGITGNKYPVCENNKTTKEYRTWVEMLRRCFDEMMKNRFPTYKDVICCEEWLLYENFYEWLHSQENFDKWFGNKNYELDKDILVKGNKAYNPSACCLVPNNINSLFIKQDNKRGKLPIGVSIAKDGKHFIATCNNPLINQRGKCIGIYNTIEEAFQVYKLYKENLIKQAAEIEYAKGNIAKKCYNAMMNYRVEIDD